MSARIAFRWALILSALAHATILGVVFSAGGGTFAAVLRAGPSPEPPAMVRAMLPLVERTLWLVEPGAATIDALGGTAWMDDALRKTGVPGAVAEWLAMLPIMATNVLLTAGVLLAVGWGGPTLLSRAWHRRRLAAV